MTNGKVGYGKPPIEHRIKPGERRNPYGRRGKSSKPPVDNSVKSILEKLDTEMIEVQGTRMTKRELELRVLQGKALKGDVRASQVLDALRKGAGVGKPGPRGGVLAIPIAPHHSLPGRDREVEAADQHFVR